MLNFLDIKNLNLSTMAFYLFLISFLLLIALLIIALMMITLVRSKKRAKVTNNATANVRLVAFLVSLLRKENSHMSRSILSGCFVVGGPIRDIYRWIRDIWFFVNYGINGKAADDIDLSTDPAKFTFLGDGFMEKVCDYMVNLLDETTLMGLEVTAQWSGPDSGTYKINVQWGEFIGSKQIVIDLSQFKSEKNEEIALNASVSGDAFRRDLTLNSLYCAIGTVFAFVTPSASENLMWFELLLTMLVAFFTKKVLDPTGSGLFTLKYDMIDLCGVRDAFLFRANEMVLGNLSGVSDTGVIRGMLLRNGITGSELKQIEDDALDTIFNDNNFIRAFRILRDVMKGASMPTWLEVAVERWVARFVNTTYTDAEIVRKVSILMMKLPKLLPSVQGLPGWSVTLLRFFFDRGTPRQRQVLCKKPVVVPNEDTKITMLKTTTPKTVAQSDTMIPSELLSALFRDTGSSVVTIASWMALFPELRLVPEDAVSFLLSAVQMNYSLKEANAFWINPVLRGSVCTPSDPVFQSYWDFLSKDLADGKLKGQLNNARVETFVKKVVTTNHRDTVLAQFLKAGPSRVIAVSGTITEPVFSLVPK